MSSLVSPERIWWKPLGKDERLWVSIALIWSLILFAMMMIWSAVGSQDVPVETYRVKPQQYQKIANDFIERYRMGTDKGIPIVRPPVGSDVYLVAGNWQWRPILELKKGATYRVHMSSLDFQHGFSLQPGNLNLMVLPDYDYVVTLTPDKAGEYQIVCNEFCGPPHHLMIGKIKVTE